MVVELCSENCGVSISSMSPRISFSHDFSQSDVIPVEKHPLRSNSSGLNPSIDFDFCVHESLELESSSADELFSDGVILPIQIKKKNINNALLKQKSQKQAPPPKPQSPPSHTVCENASSTSKGSKKEGPKHGKDLNEEVDEKQSSKSFWRFKRSSSCGSGYGRSLCPLPLLSRSNSTGSSPSVKRIPLSKEGHHHVKQNSQKRSSITRSSNSVASHNHQKPPLKRSHGSYHANGVRVSPVLNVPSANLFGFGSIFSNNRDKSKKK
ncbi:uncharacterized protein LOC109813284 [Cajanus cajan]|uniref:Uncharacterized protein n=1 Tax=Cajanus cajan TaxID=3821 RepID=A0A151S499_CAJCA|nr:uncharacterized protein LOC109813284 [Cajanus cajan]KYP49594.1 hypothetical protein KK1_028678 [Cajanus cajan]